MNKKPNQRTSSFKFKIAIEALKHDKSIVQLAQEHQLHSKQVTRWRDKLLTEGEELFIHKTTRKFENKDPDKEELLHLVDQLAAELDFLKKKLKRRVPSSES